MSLDKIENARRDIEATADLLERAAALPDFRVTDRLAVLKEEVSRA